MRRLFLGVASVLALCAASPAFAVTVFNVTPTDGDEFKFFFNSKSLSNGATGATFFGSIPKNNSNENVDVTTVGTIKTLGNGFSTVDGKNTGSDFLTSLTFTPTTGTTFDGAFFRGQLKDLPSTTNDSSNGEVIITVNGESHVVSGLGLEEDITDLGVEAADDATLITSITIAAGPGEYFKEFKQVTFSGVNGATVVGQGGGGGIPEPATWVVMLAGFGLAGTLLRRRVRAFAS